MPFRRPTLVQLTERTEAEIEARLNTGPLVARGILKVLARVIAGAAHTLFAYLDWIHRNVLPDTAEAGELERWSTIKGITRKPAVRASGTATITGVNGSTVPAGAEVRRADAVTYVTVGVATISGGTGTIAIEASEGGLDGNALEATLIALTSPAAGVQGQAIVDTPGLTGGVDRETDEELRSRLLDALSQPPHGGAEKDYERWAREVPGVTRAWAFANFLGLGTVGITIAADDDPAGPVPSQVLVDTVQAYIEDGRRPATAYALVFVPGAFVVDLQMVLTPDANDTRNAVLKSLTDLFQREGAPGRVLPLTHIREAISTATGEFDHDLLAPTADIAPPPGSFPVLGQVVFA